MGCFNMLGWNSRLPIKAGDPVFVLIMSELFKKTGDFDVYDFPPSLKYSPLALPVIGKYNEYGGVEDIKRDLNVEIIEGFFKEDIETLITNLDDNICSREYHKFPEIEPGAEITFIMDHLKVYDYLGTLKPRLDFKKAVEDSRRYYGKGETIESDLLVYPYFSKGGGERGLGNNFFGYGYFLGFPKYYLWLYKDNDMELYNSLAPDYVKFLTFLDSLMKLKFHFSSHYYAGQNDFTEDIKDYYRWLTKKNICLD